MAGRLGFFLSLGRGLCGFGEQLWDMEHWGQEITEGYLGAVNNSARP